VIVPAPVLLLSHRAVLANLNDTLNVGDTVTVSITKDNGTPITSSAPVDQKVNCDTEPVMGPFPAGVYKISLSHDGKLEAEGTLTVK
jgi:hypothetical protein